MKNQDIYNQAITILEKNAYESNINSVYHKRTLPSKEFYVHQWNWDSATHAMGLIHIDQEWAFEEITSLFSGQWENGLLPHIIFNPQEKTYFPGPEFWGTQTASKNTIASSGITQPPLVAVSIEYISQKAKDKKQTQKFLQEILPKLIAYHDHLKIYRDSENSGLLTMIHPWESGTDNSPRWDQALEQINIENIPQEIKDIVHKSRTDTTNGHVMHRPQINDYYRYIFLVDLYKTWNWDFTKIIKESPFAVKDILFNSIWCKANESLAILLEANGQKEKAKKYRRWAKQTRNAIQNTWNEKTKMFTGVNVAQGQSTPLNEHTIASFMPLYAGAVKEKQLLSLLNQLYDKKKYYSEIPFPSTSLDNPKFELTRYWRGPTWPITNLLLIEGLNGYSHYPLCEVLKELMIQKTLTMIENHGFYEYYNPFGENTAIEKQLGFGSFSWSAAIYIYLIEEYKTNTVTTVILTN